MRKQAILLGVVLSLALVPAEAEDWAIQADVAESCSCHAACPCVFGSPATKDHCRGSRLVAIREGHYGDVAVDGISVVVTFSMGEWVKYYVDEKATDAQFKAVEELMNQSFPVKLLSSERVPLTVERTDDRVRFSVPASMVEIEVMKGRNDKPIQVHNLAGDYLMDYAQFKSIENRHDGGDETFQYSGTNGFTSRMDAKSE